MTAGELTPEELVELKKKVNDSDQVKRKPNDFPNPVSVKNAKLGSPCVRRREEQCLDRFRILFHYPLVFFLTLTMTIYRCEKSGQLTILNAFWYNEALEKEILELGPITHVVKLGQCHGDADAYYDGATQFNKPKLWTLPGGSVAEGTAADKILLKTNLPVEDTKLINMKGHPFLECLMTVPCWGGPLLVACDSRIHLPELNQISYTS